MRQQVLNHALPPPPYHQQHTTATLPRLPPPLQQALTTSNNNNGGRSSDYWPQPVVPLLDAPAAAAAESSSVVGRRASDPHHFIAAAPPGHEPHPSASLGTPDGSDPDTSRALCHGALADDPDGAVFVVPKAALVHIPLGMSTPLTFCNAYAADPEGRGGGGCPAGADCPHAHADLSAAQRHVPHVRGAEWAAPGDVPYAMYDPDDARAVRVKVTNSAAGAEVVSVRECLRTAVLEPGSELAQAAAVEASDPPPSTQEECDAAAATAAAACVTRAGARITKLYHCAHWLVKRKCNYGPDCRFVHVALPSAQTLQQAAEMRFRRRARWGESVTSATSMATTQSPPSPQHRHHQQQQYQHRHHHHPQQQHHRSSDDSSWTSQPPHEALARSGMAESVAGHDEQVTAAGLAGKFVPFAAVSAAQPHHHHDRRLAQHRSSDGSHLAATATKSTAGVDVSQQKQSFTSSLLAPSASVAVPGPVADDDPHHHNVSTPEHYWESMSSALAAHDTWQQRGDASLQMLLVSLDEGRERALVDQSDDRNPGTTARHDHDSPTTTTTRRRPSAAASPPQRAFPFRHNPYAARPLAV